MVWFSAFSTTSEGHPCSCSRVEAVRRRSWMVSAHWHEGRGFADAVNVGHHFRPLCQPRFCWRLREGLARLNQPRSGSLPVEWRILNVVFEAVPVPAVCGFFLSVMVAPYAARAFLRSPTFHAVTRSDSLRGAGRVPRLTMRQTVADEQPLSAATTGRRTFAESGSESKFLSASGIALGSVWCAMLCCPLM